MNLQQPLSLTDVVAFWGAVTGTASIIITYFTYKRDAARIKVDVKKGWRVIHSSDYDPNEDQIVIDVSNKGRRPITITSVGYVFLKREGGVILSDSIIFGARELHEGKNTHYIMTQNNIEDFSEISHFAVYDATGNAYKKYVTPVYKRFLYWLLFTLHLKKKGEFKKI